MFLCFSAYDYVIEAKGKMLVKTDIQIALFDGCYGRIGEWVALCSCPAVFVEAGIEFNSLLLMNSIQFTNVGYGPGK